MKHIKPYKSFSDNRGSFLGILNSGHWEEINYVETEANQTRGGHYHKETLELFYIIEGSIDITLKDTVNEHIKAFTAIQGDIFVIEPYEIHTFVTKTKCKWINILSKRIDDQFNDMHK